MDYIQYIERAEFINKPMYHYFRSREGSELEQIYKFDLFEKKKEHYFRTKKLLEDWKINDDKNWTILYTFFAERILQCIMEINSNHEFSNKEKCLKIKNIFNDKEAVIAIKFAKPQSLLMKLMMIPLKRKSMIAVRIETFLINLIRVKQIKIYTKMKAEKVNKSAGESQ